MDVAPSPQELVLKELKRLQKAYKRDRNVANSKYGRDFFNRIKNLFSLLPKKRQIKPKCF